MENLINLVDNTIKQSEQKSDREAAIDNIAHDAAEEISLYAFKHNCYDPLLFSRIKPIILSAIRQAGEL